MKKEYLFENPPQKSEIEAFLLSTKEVIYWLQEMQDLAKSMDSGIRKYHEKPRPKTNPDYNKNFGKSVYSVAKERYENALRHYEAFKDISKTIEIFNGKYLNYNFLETVEVE